MFFAPPKVKSLSKYSEFGSHLGSRDFLWMVGAAAVLHIIIVAVYSMTPHEQTLIIPVRVLNIKLNGGAVGFNPQPEPVAPAEQKTGVNEERRSAGKIEFQHERPLAQAAAADKADKVYSGSKQKPLIEILTQNTEKRKKPGEDVTLKEHDILQKPKKYVRVTEMNTAQPTVKGGGNGSGIAGTSEGREIVRNYEQEISLWMAKHKNYPEEAKQKRIEGSAVVRIRIDRTGHIIYNAIDVSSGNAIIDQAVMAMVHDSDPVPRVPDNYPTGSELEFLIPVSFRLQ
jgi:protein TonB